MPDGAGVPLLEAVLEGQPEMGRWRGRGSSWHLSKTRDAIGTRVLSSATSPQVRFAFRWRVRQSRSCTRETRSTNRPAYRLPTSTTPRRRAGDFRRLLPAGSGRGPTDRDAGAGPRRTRRPRSAGVEASDAALREKQKTASGSVPACLESVGRSARPPGLRPCRTMRIVARQSRARTTPAPANSHEPSSALSTVTTISARGNSNRAAA